MIDVEKALREIARGAQEIIPIEELKTKLSSGRQLIIKLGMDPTAPDIHLGHTVILNKLRTFQELGHKVILIIGDFTAAVGDPSGKNTTRPQLSREKILENAQTYATQAFKILDKEKTEIRYNSEWLSKLGTDGTIALASKLTVARMLEREDFTKRFQGGIPIAIHEFLYPLFQGYDSVALKADVELGGTDQKFNLLMGRELQKDAGIEPQCVLMMPLLVGLDGVKKMSKSAGNYIGVHDAPAEMFGKIMSLSDDLMWSYFELLSFRPIEEIEDLKKRCASGMNPRDAKIELGREIVARYHGDEAANAAVDGFINQFAKGAIPEQMDEFTLEFVSLPNLLKDAALCASTSEAMRMIKQNAVKCDGEVISDVKATLGAGTYVISVGKRRFARITIA
ncbi:tyrosine--tRNA ligase [Anaerobiospirillum thomasii]|uniref:Tyrosine--tRNA ligase n=1 Tax=Anaerobiospirillum thomasii TaxID=179995 RepID=A0A2X0VMM4_9GAMM|nr:tyrosine--tRNA ligase [Anaerobiospirillum thomasii]SPT70758.1 Tyrosine--tRNA ligase [Anaerobiospirillum thomasii]